MHTSEASWLALFESMEVTLELLGMLAAFVLCAAQPTA